MREIDLFYAEDDDDDLMFFNEAVERISNTLEIKINLKICKNGENLVENLKQIKSSNAVVFLDINMPLKSGFQLLEEIRRHPATKQIPVIMFSTSSSLDNIDKSFSLGASYYAVKPYEFGKLMKMIAKFAAMDWENHQPDAGAFLYQ